MIMAVGYPAAMGFLIALALIVAIIAFVVAAIIRDVRYLGVGLAILAFVELVVRWPG